MQHYSITPLRCCRPYESPVTPRKLSWLSIGILPIKSCNQLMFFVFTVFRTPVASLLKRYMAQFFFIVVYMSPDMPWLTFNWSWSAESVLSHSVLPGCLEHLLFEYTVHKKDGWKTSDVLNVISFSIQSHSSSKYHSMNFQQTRESSYFNLENPKINQKFSLQSCVSFNPVTQPHHIGPWVSMKHRSTLLYWYLWYVNLCNKKFMVHQTFTKHLDVSKNRGIPKMDDL